MCYHDCFSARYFDSESLIMSDPACDLFELYRARNLSEAHLLRVALEQAGVRAVVDNESLNVTGADENLWQTAPRVLVSDADEDAARTILQQFLQAAVDRAKGASLRCLACKTPMGAAEVCPQCGWTYLTDDADGEIDSTESPDVISEPLPQQSTVSPTPLLSRSAIWWEIGAVLAIGVVPGLLGSIAGLIEPLPAPTFWVGSFHSIGRNACTIFVMLYIISRSGESWESFGITRPTILDFIIAIGLLVAVDVLWHVVRMFPIDDSVRPIRWLAPRTTGDHLWMWAWFLAGGFSEELVSRCYLITRLTTQLRSRTAAVFTSAACFASFHIYQGSFGTFAAFAFGLLFGSLYLLRPRIWPFALGHAFSNIALVLHAAG